MTDLNGSRAAGTGGRQAALPGPVRDLHRAILRRFLHDGAAPTLRWVQQATTELGLTAAATDQLEAADLVHIADGAVRVAYPLSGTPTRQRVELDGLPAVYAMCAIDALGMPAMTGRDGQITASDPRDGAPVVVSRRDGVWNWTPDRAVVVYGRSPDCGTSRASWEAMCPNTTFAVSRDSARAYLAGRDDIDGQIIGQQHAIDVATHTFGPLLGGRV